MYAKDGETSQADARLFAIDGRDAITEPGDIPFFRALTVGDQGDDVIQLKEILAASGFNPGPRNSPLHRTDTVRARAMAGREPLPGRDSRHGANRDRDAGAVHRVHHRRAVAARASSSVRPEPAQSREPA